jgi:hypothetical protein
MRFKVKFADALGAAEAILDGTPERIGEGVWEKGESLPVGATLRADDGRDVGAEEAGVVEAGAELGEETGAEEAGVDEIAELGRVTGEVDREIATHPPMRPSPPLRRLPEHTWMVMLVPSIVKLKLPDPKTPK